LQWVLYIDDDQDDRQLFQEVCNEVHPNVKCVVANDGIAGLEILKENKSPMCIYVDMNMPYMNGIEVLKAIKNMPKFSPIPVFILSTSKTTRLEIDARANGATDYLLKPIAYSYFVSLLTLCYNQHIRK
jgi:CheY-like chemotaxis protein